MTNHPPVSISVPTPTANQAVTFPWSTAPCRQLHSSYLYLPCTYLSCSHRQAQQLSLVSVDLCGGLATTVHTVRRLARGLHTTTSSSLLWPTRAAAMQLPSRGCCRAGHTTLPSTCLLPSPASFQLLPPPPVSGEALEGIKEAMLRAGRQSTSHSDPIFHTHRQPCSLLMSHVGAICCPAHLYAVRHAGTFRVPALPRA